MENDKKTKRVSRFRLICIRAFAWQPRKKKKTVKRTTKANQRKSCRDKNVNLPNQKEQKKPNNQIKSTTRRAMNRDVAVDNLSPVGRKCSFFFRFVFRFNLRSTFWQLQRFQQESGRWLMSPPGPFRNVEFDPVFTGFYCFFFTVRLYFTRFL